MDNHTHIYTYTHRYTYTPYENTHTHIHTHTHTHTHMFMIQIGIYTLKGQPMTNIMQSRTYTDIYTYPINIIGQKGKSFNP